MHTDPAIQSGLAKHDVERLAKLIQESGCAERTLDVASHHMAKARESLDVFPESPAKDALLSLSDFVIARSW
jgi:octaprenyl-diphosphate synthase